MVESLPLGLRRAEASDMSWLAQEIIDGSWPGPITQLPWPEWVGSDRHFVYLLEQERLLGILAISPSEPLVPKRAAIELLVWCMHPDMRDRQLGRKLLVHGISGARRLGGDDLICWVEVGRAVPEAALAQSGFKPLMERHNFSQARSSSERGWVLDITAYF